MSPLQLKFWTQFLTTPEVPISAIRSLFHNPLHVYFPCQYWTNWTIISAIKSMYIFLHVYIWSIVLKKLYICSINSTLYSHVKKMLDFMKSFIHSALQSTKTTENPILLSQYIKFNNGKDNVGVPNSKHPRDFKNSERNEQFSLIQEILSTFVRIL